jgi:hypothetical protein
LKRLIDLTIEDLTATPVWRYEGGSGAEAVVVPTGRTSLSAADDEVFLAATEFTLPDSSQHLGFCFPVDDSGIDYLQPVIVTRGSHISFWFDGPIAQEVLSSQWNALGKRVEDVFPVHFRCLVPVGGRTVTGVILNVESSADTSSTGDAGPIHDASRSIGAIADPAPRATGTTRGGRRTSARGPFAFGSGRGRIKRPPRHNVEMMVEFDQGESRGTGVTRDISSGGMFVRAARVPNVGPSLHLTVLLPSGRKLHLRGKVVRSASATGLPRPATPPGFGVRLTDQPAEYEELLSRLLGTPK